MTIESTAKPLTAAQKKVQELEAKLKKARAVAQLQENKIKARQISEARRIDTRKKVLVGSWIFAGGDPLQFQNAAGVKLDAWLTREDERQLFGLPVQDKSLAEIKN